MDEVQTHEYAASPLINSNTGHNKHTLCLTHTAHQKCIIFVKGTSTAKFVPEIYIRGRWNKYAASVSLAPMMSNGQNTGRPNVVRNIAMNW